jgi:hypothetical protein
MPGEEQAGDHRCEITSGARLEECRSLLKPLFPDHRVRKSNPFWRFERKRRPLRDALIILPQLIN